MYVVSCYNTETVMILLIILFTLSSTDYETLAGKSQTSTAEPKSKQNWKPAVSLVASGLSDAVQQCCYSCHCSDCCCLLSFSLLQLVVLFDAC